MNVDSEERYQHSTAYVEFIANKLYAVDQGVTIGNHFIEVSGKRISANAERGVEAPEVVEALLDKDGVEAGLAAALGGN